MVVRCRAVHRLLGCSSSGLCTVMVWVVRFSGLALNGDWVNWLEDAMTQRAGRTCRVRICEQGI